MGKPRTGKSPLRGLAYKPWHLLGFGYYQAWVFLALLSTVLFTQPEFFADHVQFTRQYFSLTLVIFLFILMFVSPKLSILLKRKHILVVTSVFTAVGTAMIAFPIADFSLKTTIVVIGMTLTGFGNSFLIISWGQLWSQMNTDRMGFHLVIANVFAGFLYLIVVQLPSQLAILITMALPFFSTFTLLASESDPKREPQTKPLPPSKGLLGKAIVVIAAIPFVFGIARAFASLPNAFEFNVLQHHIVVGTTIFSIIVAVLTIMAPQQQTVLRLYHFVVPLMAIGFIALPFVPSEQQWIAFSAIWCGFYSFEGLVWLLQPEYVFKTKKSAIRVFGWSRCLFHFFGFVGVTFGFFWIDQGIGSNGVPVAVCLVVVIVLIVISTYIFTEHDLRMFIRRPPVVKEKDENGKLHHIARDNGLSQREEEVFLMLAKGRSVPFMAEALFISKGTVKTHVRHIYEKLGIHTKQEMLDLVERESQLEE